LQAKKGLGQEGLTRLSKKRAGRKLEVFLSTGKKRKGGRSEDDERGGGGGGKKKGTKGGKTLQKNGGGYSFPDLPEEPRLDNEPLKWRPGVTKKKETCSKKRTIVNSAKEKEVTKRNDPDYGGKDGTGKNYPKGKRRIRSNRSC